MRTRSLVQLATDNTGNVIGGVRVREEVGWILLNLLDGEAGASVLALLDDAGLEWTDHAAHGDLVRVRARVLGLRVGEGDARGPVATLGSLVNVGCGIGGRLVGTGNTLESDVLERLMDCGLGHSG